jgi:Holliday junction resolvase
MTPEAAVKSKLKAILKDLNIYYVSPMGTGFGGDVGVPDILACVNGKFIGIECKAGKNKATALQAKHLLKIQQSGGISMIVDDNTDFVNLRLILLGVMSND